MRTQQEAEKIHKVAVRKKAGEKEEKAVDDI